MMYFADMGNEFSQNIGLRLIKYMAARGLSKKAFADKIGEDHHFLTKLTEGNDVSTGFIGRLADTFPDLNLGWVLYGQGDMLRQPEAKASSVAEELAQLQQELTAAQDLSLVISSSAKAERLDGVMRIMDRLTGFLLKVQGRQLDAHKAMMEIMYHQINRPL